MPATLTTLSMRFAFTLDGLCGAVAARAAANRAIAPLLLLVWGRLRRIAARFDVIVAQIQAGTYTPPPTRPPSSRPRPHQGSARAPHTLPRGFGWLIRLVPGHPAASYRSQLLHLLTDPEMAPVIAAAPGIGRLLRPLCQMLAIRPGPDIAAPPRLASRSPDQPRVQELPTSPPPTSPPPNSQPSNPGQDATAGRQLATLPLSA